MQWFGGNRERAVDWAVALVAFALTVALLVVPEDHTGRSFDGIGLLLSALSTFPLLARRRHPLAVFAFVTLVSSTLYALDYPAGPPIGPTIALFNLALAKVEVLGSQKATAVLAALLYAGHVGGNAIANGFDAAAFVLGGPLWAAAWFAGDRTRLRRERIAELEERALRAEREAERERRLAAAEERTRIARDLHDSAGHAINVILVQAGAARVLGERDPAAARRALETIEDVARETLGEIDQLVRVLREGSTEEIEPPVGLSALDSVVQRQRATGFGVDVQVRGERRPLPPAVDQAAFRILQEALTNAARHGFGDADVELVYRERALEVVVANPAVNGAVGGEGHGLVGMRERAAMVGGHVDAGLRDGSFRVRAVLPYSGARS